MLFNSSVLYEKLYFGNHSTYNDDDKTNITLTNVPTPLKMMAFMKLIFFLNPKKFLKWI